MFTSQMGLYGACIATVRSSAGVLLSRFVGIWLFKNDLRHRVNPTSPQSGGTKQGFS